MNSEHIYAVYMDGEYFIGSEFSTHEQAAEQVAAMQAADIRAGETHFYNIEQVAPFTGCEYKF